jgi:hypothetical protein
MATTTGKAARRVFGTKANAKRARKHAPKDFADTEAVKARYREAKRQRKEALKKGTPRRHSSLQGTY